VLRELIHDAHELQLLRNRVVRCLAESGRITAVALESGLTDMTPLQQALLQAPRSGVALTRERISYSCGGLPEVPALTELIRSDNSKRPSGRGIRPASHVGSMFRQLGRKWLLIDLRAAAQDSALA
jgi:erythromycin esterase-like protein